MTREDDKRGDTRQLRRPAGSPIQMPLIVRRRCSGNCRSASTVHTFIIPKYCSPSAGA
jgi:hypothetical protein